MNIITRPATTNDQAAIIALWRERRVILSQSDPRFGNSTETLPDCVYFVAQTENDIRGYIACGLIDGWGVVVDMALDAHTYHSGLGRALLDAARGWFTPKDVRGIVARVPRYHPVEQAFWRALGANEWTAEGDLWQKGPEYIWMRL